MEEKAREVPEGLNGAEAAAASGPRFALRDGATGKIFEVVDMNDEMLLRFMREMSQELENRHAMLEQAKQMVIGATGIMNVLLYEHHRRNRNRIQIAPADAIRR